MSYQEKHSLINIFSGWLLMALYGWIIFQKHQAGQFDLTTDFQTWGILFLIFVGVSVVARIVIYIIYHIINAIITREEELPVEDERDKLIKLKASKNSQIAFSVCILLAFSLLALGMPVYGIIIAMAIGGLLTELVENLSQMYYYRRA